MSNSSPETSQVSKRNEPWCPPNMQHSHIGAFIDYFQDIVEIKEYCYIPLIKEWGNSLKEADNEQEEQIIKKLEKVRKLNLIKINEENNVEVLNKQTTAEEKLKEAEEKLKEAEKKLKEAEKKLKEAEEDVNTYYQNNFYPLLLRIFDDKNKGSIEPAVKAFLLRLFNHLAISILKAEYSLFDNYSDILSKITGFEFDPAKDKSKENFKILYLYNNPDKIEVSLSQKASLSQYVDQYLVKLMISCIWYLIEICKTIDHKVNKNKFDAFFQVVNKNRKQRIKTIYPIPEEKRLINREIVDLFELSLESILDLTLIDHYFCFTKDNFDKLFVANERISSLHDILDPEGISQRKEKYDFENPLKESKKENLFDDFSTIKNIVEIKSKLLLKQLKESFDDKPINNKKFDEQFDFLFYGIKNEDDTNNFDKYIDNSICFDFNVPVEYNTYTRAYLKIVKEKKQQETNINDADFDFLKPYNEDQLEKCKKCDARDKKRCKKHCATGICNTKRDIIDFNDCSKISIDNFNKNSLIITQITALNNKDDNCQKLRDLINDHSRFSSFLQKLKDILFEDKLEGFDNEKLQKLKLNPTNLTFFIDFFKLVLDCFLEDFEKEEHKVKIEEIDDIYDFYKKLIYEFNAYIRAKENTAYTIGEFRFSPPFQYCFYQLNKSGKSGKYQLQSYQRIEADFIDKNNIEIDNDNFFFFFSAGLHPINVFRLSEKNKQYQDEFSHIRNRIRALKAQKGLIELSKKYDDGLSQTENALNQTKTTKEEIEKNKKELEETKKEFEKIKTHNVATLGILGSFIAFVSFATGTLKAVDTVAEFVIFAFVFCIAVASFGLIINLGFAEAKKIVFQKRKTKEKEESKEEQKEKETNELRRWVTTTIIVVSIIVVFCLGCFLWKEIQNRNTDKQKPCLKIENIIQSEGVTAKSYFEVLR